ncbi:aminotransferase class IV family protein [Rhizobium sp. FKY42]|uniref:aminotransferase class IV family protein n=1 Tax=Rhizobium sp. FKY42 TaxID=2562310 RepID=UPI0010C0E0D0|nr:aminotransferase class IV family protein [Rhizobium sp. FKY42]
MPAQSALRSKSAADFSLIETIRWEPGQGFLRLEQHLRRLTRSADALGFRQPLHVTKLLEEAVEGAATPMRARLTVSFRGKAEVAATAFEPVAEDTVWKLKIAKQTLLSDDTLFRHKTSRRDPYEAARAEYSPEEADEVLLLNERGELCEGTITNLFVEAEDGQLLTPALNCGLLPGVLRAELIRERKARSEVLKPADLKHRRIFVGNSLRGLIPAELV